MIRSHDLDQFHEELRRKNLSILAWSAVVFNVAYVAWTVFDRVLAPAHAQEFLLWRLAASGLNTVLVLAIRRARWRRYTWEAFWVWLFVFGGFIAPMLPVVGDAFVAYVLGFTIILFGAGLLPFWPPRWAVTNVVAVIAVATLGLLTGTPVASRDLVAGGAFVATSAGLALVMAWYKYDFSKRDFFTRHELSETLHREEAALAAQALAARELEQANARLKQIDERKNTFFANVSHELRTPLTLILAPVDEMLETSKEPEQRHQLAVVRRNAERLLRLIDDLLDLARLDAGGLRLNLAEMDLRTITQIVHENGLPAAKARGIEFTYVAGPSTRSSFADAHRIEMVMTNLVGNALKYTPDGGRVALRVRDDADAVVAEVEDTGPGISAEDVPHVFDRFFQAGRNDRRHPGGVGIGLSLARELAELHGGRIEVASELGRGTTFSLRIPFGRDHIRPEAVERRKTLGEPGRYARRAGDPATLAPALAADEVHASPLPAVAGAAPVRRARILVAEDNDELRRLMVDLLSSEHEVIVARDGDEALALVRRERPDLLVSDVMMPGKSGVEVCHLVKADPLLRSTPIILLTARVGSEATLEGYAQGADDFVAKPFHPRVLLARIRAQLRLRELALQLAEQEKLAAVGTLAAGILHEVRNPINAILNAARVLAAGTTPARQGPLIEVVNEAASRIHTITTALDAHVRPADGGMAGPTVLGDSIDSALRLLGHRLGNVVIHRELAIVSLVEAPPAPVNQVVLNLLDNALDAGAAQLWVVASSQDGKVRLTISDDGPGVPGEVQERIFEPFVSGKGTSGLGLYLSRRIVEQHGGRLWFQPRSGGGASFTVELPGTGPA